MRSSGGIWKYRARASSCACPAFSSASPETTFSNSRTFPVLAEVRKTREIYRFQGVQVHLDVVQDLGKFLEFEKVVSGDAEEAAGRAQLESLRRYFQIEPEDLMASSYSDLLGA